MATRRYLSKRQAGAVLLEALVAILIFSMGIIALMGLQAVSIKSSIDAKYRADAAYLANQVIGQMWVDRANIDKYAHNPSGALCNFSGAASTYNPNMIGVSAPNPGWLKQVADTLPGAASNFQQIIVTTPTANTRLVTVTVCWKAPQETIRHNFVATAEINMP